MRLGDRIKQARKAKHLTQEQVAADLHVSRVSVSGWEKHKFVPDRPHLRALAKILGDPEIALYSEGTPSPTEERLLLIARALSISSLALWLTMGEALAAKEGPDTSPPSFRPETPRRKAAAGR